MGYLRDLGHLKWHSLVLVAVLAFWGLGSFVRVVYLLATAVPELNLGLLDYYVFLAAPLLILAAALLLSARSKWVLVPFVLLPLVYAVTAMRLHPSLLDPFRHTLDWRFFALVPPVYLVAMGFFFACSIYAAFLLKSGQLR